MSSGFSGMLPRSLHQAISSFVVSFKDVHILETRNDGSLWVGVINYIADINDGAVKLIQRNLKDEYPDLIFNMFIVPAEYDSPPEGTWCMYTLRNN